MPFGNGLLSGICRNAILGCIAIIAAACNDGVAIAGEADVTSASAHQSADGSWRFDVTVSHADEGWAHYADRFDIVTLDGKLLGERVLLHPHVTEQPFTRSLADVVIPPDVLQVEIRAHDKVHELGGKTLVLTLPQAGQ